VVTLGVAIGFNEVESFNDEVGDHEKIEVLPIAGLVCRGTTVVEQRVVSLFNKMFDSNELDAQPQSACVGFPKVRPL